MFIYKITNIINNKVYIGQSIRPIEKRFDRHINDAINNVLDTHFARAIRKYGKDNFKLELIDTAENQEDLNLKEQYWIRYYNSVENGYNETDALFKCGGNTYKSKTKEEMKIIGDKISKKKKGTQNSNSRSIKCYNIKTDEEIIFSTVNECREYFQEKNHRFITTRAQGDVHSYYQNKWMIAYTDCPYGEYHNRQKTGKRIKVIDITSQEEKEYVSVRQMCRELKINRNIVTKTIQKTETFIIDNWKFIILN